MTSSVAYLRLPMVPAESQAAVEPDQGFDRTTHDDLAFYADNVSVIPVTCAHIWPSDLDTDAECEGCGLDYEEWSL